MRLVFFLLVFTFSACAKNIDEKLLNSYVGHWEYEKTVDGADVPYSSFTLDIALDNGIIFGKYCYITQYGAKEDCNPKVAENFRGAEKNDSGIKVKFISNADAVNGLVTLEIRGDKLVWSVLNSPVNGAFYGPMKALLRKEPDTELSKDDAGSEKEGATLGEQQGTLKKITSEKAYLLSNPSELGLTKSYLIKDDQVEIVGRSQNKIYWNIIYKSKKGYLNKWIRCEDISFCSQ